MPFAVGDRVTANYHGEGDYYPGVIKKCRPDGTFDIDYDDGDKELRVTESNIQPIGEDELDNTLASVDNNKDVTMTSSLDVNEVSQFNDTTTSVIEPDAGSEHSDDPFEQPSDEEETGDDILELSQDSVLNEDRKLAEQTRSRGTSDDRDSLDISVSPTPAATPAPQTPTAAQGGSDLPLEDDDAQPDPPAKEQHKEEADPSEHSDSDVTDKKKDKSKGSLKPWKLFSRGKADKESDNAKKNAETSDSEAEKAPKSKTDTKKEEAPTSNEEQEDSSCTDKKKDKSKPWKKLFGGKKKEKTTKSLAAEGDEAQSDVDAPSEQHEGDVPPKSGPHEQSSSPSDNKRNEPAEKAPSDAQQQRSSPSDTEKGKLAEKAPRRSLLSRGKAAEQDNAKSKDETTETKPSAEGAASHARDNKDEVQKEHPHSDVKDNQTTPQADATPLKETESEKLVADKASAPRKMISRGKSSDGPPPSGAEPSINETSVEPTKNKEKDASKDPRGTQEQSTESATATSSKNNEEADQLERPVETEPSEIAKAGKRPFQRRMHADTAKATKVNYSDSELQDHLAEIHRSLHETHKPLSAMLLIVEQYIKTKQLNLFQPITLRFPDVKLLLQQLLPNTPTEKLTAFAHSLQNKYANDDDTIDLQPWIHSLANDWQPTMPLMQRLLGQALSSLISASMNPDAPVSLRRVYEALYAYSSQPIAGSLVSSDEFFKAISSLGLPFVNASDIDLMKHHYDYACISIADISLLVEHLLDVPPEASASPSNAQPSNATLLNLIAILTTTSSTLKWTPAQIKQAAADLLSGNAALIPKLVHGAVAVDSEGTGALSSDMLTRLLCSIGVPVTSLQANQFIKEYAQDAPNGVIDVDILMKVLNVDTNSLSVTDTAKETSAPLYATASQLVVLLINTLLPPAKSTAPEPTRRLKRRRLDAKRDDNGSRPVKVFNEPQAATMIQKVYRGKRQRKLEKKQNIAATSIQRIIRGRRTQRQYSELRQRVAARKAEELERYKRLRRIQDQERELHLLLALPSSKYHSLENMKRNSKAKVIQRSWRKKKNLIPPALHKSVDHDVNDTMKKANDIVNRLMDIGTGSAPMVSKREASSSDLMRVWDSIRAKTKTPQSFGVSARRKYQNYYATKQSADVIYNEYRNRRSSNEDTSQHSSVATCTLLAKQLSAPPSLDEAYKLIQGMKSVTPTTSPSKEQLSPNSYKAKRQLRVHTGAENEPAFPVPQDSFFHYLPTNNVHEAAIQHVQKAQALGSKWHWSWVPGPGSTVIDIRDYDSKPLESYSKKKNLNKIDDAESSLAWAMYASTITDASQPDTKLVKELSKTILKGKQKRQSDIEDKYAQLIRTRNTRAEAILQQSTRATVGYQKSRSMLVRSAPHPHIAATKIQQWYRRKLQREQSNRQTAENRVLEALKVLITELRATDVTTDALQSMMLNLDKSSKPVPENRISADATRMKHQPKAQQQHIPQKASSVTPRLHTETPRSRTETPRAAAETPRVAAASTPRGILASSSHTPRPPTTPRASAPLTPSSPESNFSPATPRALASTPKHARFHSPESPQSAFTPLSYPSPYTPLHYISSPSQSASEFPTMSSIAEHMETAPSALANLQHVLHALNSEDWATRSMIEILITSPPSDFDKTMANGLLQELLVTYGPLPLLRFMQQAAGHSGAALSASLPLTECIYAIVELCHVSGLFPEIHDPDSDTAKDKIVSIILFLKFQANSDGCIDSLNFLVLLEELWCSIVPEHGTSYIQEVNEIRFQIMLKAKQSMQSDAYAYLQSLFDSNHITSTTLIQALQNCHISIAPVTAQDAIRMIAWNSDADEADANRICEYFGVAGTTFRSVQVKTQMLLRALNITPPKGSFTQSQFLEYMDKHMIPLGEYEKRLLFHILQREGGGGADMKHLGEVKSGYFLPAALKT